MRRRLPLAVGLVALLACGRGDDGSPRGEARRDPALPDLPPAALRDQFVQHGLLLPIGTRREMRDTLGTPRRVSSEAVTNRHDPARTDSIVRLHYPGLVAEYYVVSQGPTEMLQAVRTTTGRWLRFPALGVGAPRERLRRGLGEPGHAADSVWEYECGSCMGASSPVRFHLRRDTVHAVEFRYYVD